MKVIHLNSCRSKTCFHFFSDFFQPDFIHELKRLLIGLDKTVQEIYEAARGIVSDAHSVNKGLAAEIFRQFCLEWTPSQLYCCIHTVFGFQEGMMKIWLRYQEKIGYDKIDWKTIPYKTNSRMFLKLTADR